MELLGRIAVVVGVISAFTFVILFGRLPALRKTPIGWLNAFLVDSVPRYIAFLDQKITGERCLPVLQALGNYLFYTNNPIVLIIFMTILTGSASMFLSQAQLSTAQYLPLVFLLPPPYIFTYLSATCRSIRITHSNIQARLHDYPYDHALFRPNTICETCNLPKPARSKHCSLCGTCVAKADHHCPWLANCLGKDNYRYFLGLLLSIFLLEVYGAYLAYSLLAPYARAGRDTSQFSMFSAIYWDRIAAQLLAATEKGGLSIAGVGILATATAPLPAGMLGYHIYLIWAGTTTNENAKWGFLKEDMDDGIVFKARRSEVLAYKRRIADSQNAGGRAEEEEPKVDWPVETDQIISRTTDGLAPRGLEHMYEQVWSLRAVENLYDLGFWDNLVYALKGR